MKYALIVFDMDGTILNTLDDLTTSLNHALESCGFPLRTLAEVRLFAGNGVRKLVERGVPQGTGQQATDRALEVFLAHYQLHCADQTRPYEGVVELIRSLREAGCQTAVVSNKVDAAVQELCKTHFDGLFDAAVGERPGMRQKPASDSVDAVLRELGVERAQAAYVGDSEVDIETAINAGLASVIVDWGYRDRDFLIARGAKTIVFTPQEALRALL